jgi:hypothetical protein
MPRYLRQALVKDNGGQHDRGGRLDRVDDRQAERQRPRVEGALPEQGAEYAHHEQRVRLPGAQDAPPSVRKDIDGALGERV